jgi:sugar phosphate isomerase/epimerase
MCKIYITTSVFGKREVLENGQEFYLPVIAKLGANGVEIREELMREEDISLKQLRTILEKENLECVYSSPAAIWREDEELNKEVINSTVLKAIELGAKIVKFSLGNCKITQSSMKELKKTIQELKVEENNLFFTVENDQTSCGGNLNKLRQFFKASEEYKLPIKMTFDVGNWNWTNENPVKAAEELSNYVAYIHFKHVELNDGKLNTLPLPEDLDAIWRTVLLKLPQNVMRAIEFPVVGEDFEKEISKYVKLLKEV